MFVNKLFTYLMCAYLKKCFNVKTKVLTDIQICISVPLSGDIFWASVLNKTADKSGNE